MDILTLAIAKNKFGSANETITTENITNALGYKPASQEDISKLSDTMNDTEKQLYIDGLNLEEVKKTGTEIFIDKKMKNVVSNLVPITVYPSNRFDYTKLDTSVNSYNASHTITKENNGLKIVRQLITTQAYTLKNFNYVAEFDGNLWFSCVAKADNVKDVAVRIYVNNVEKEFMYGLGKIYACIPVSKGDNVNLKFYTCIGNTETGNTIYYSDIMLQYETMTDEFVPYKKNYDNSEYIMKTLTLDGVTHGVFDDWTTMNTMDGERYYFKYNNALDILTEVLPQTSSEIGDWKSNFTQGAPTEVQNGVKDCISIFTNGVLGIYIDSVQFRANLSTYLQSNPITITYAYSKDGMKIINTVNEGDVLVSDSNIELIGYCEKDIEKTINYVAFGDSITGMFGNGTSYPEMIEQKTPNVKAHNCGFSGSQITDHSNANYLPFSFNRLVDSIISKDWSSQDNIVNNINVNYYPEHLTVLKNIDFNTVDYVSLFYGTNDWGACVSIESMKSVYKESITKLLMAFPHLKIIVICPYWSSLEDGKDSNNDPNVNNEYLYDYADVIEEVAKKNFNCPTINLYWNLGANAITNRYFTQDGTHPTFSTRQRIANEIIKKF